MAPHEGLGPVEPVPAALEPLDTSRPFRWRHPVRARPRRGPRRLRRCPGPRPGLRSPHQRGHRSPPPSTTVGPDGGLVAAATDGETFGHHHQGAEHDVAHALTVGAPAQGVATPRLVDVLDGRPPTHEARVRTSAWSCAHGVGRWMHRLRVPHRRRRRLEPGVAGAASGGLRPAARLGRRGHGAAAAASCCATRGRPATPTSGCCSALCRGTTSWPSTSSVTRTGRACILDAQRNALLMYTSCGWFFNDLAGIETVQVLRYAARAIDLYRELGEDLRWRRSSMSWPAPSATTPRRATAAASGSTRCCRADRTR